MLASRCRLFLIPRLVTIMPRTPMTRHTSIPPINSMERCHHSLIVATIIGSSRVISRLLNVSSSSNQTCIPAVTTIQNRTNSGSGYFLSSSSRCIRQSNSICSNSSNSSSRAPICFTEHFQGKSGLLHCLAPLFLRQCGRKVLFLIAHSAQSLCLRISTWLHSGPPRFMHHKGPRTMSCSRHLAIRDQHTVPLLHIHQVVQAFQWTAMLGTRMVPQGHRLIPRISTRPHNLETRAVGRACQVPFSAKNMPLHGTRT